MPPKEEDSGALHLISDILDKLIDTQQSNAESNTALKNIVVEAVREIAQMKSHFTNGFKSELKKYITDESEKQTEILIQSIDEQPHLQILQRITEIEAQIKQIDENVRKNYDNIISVAATQKSLWHWVTHVGIVIVGVGTVIAALIKIIQLFG